ncbi:serine protease [Thermaurantimonas aggregans]|uniref:Serine protease n=1 Tax=Thermaurantimonas aggregans TaxID=2173829 RepID=A0A401XIK3_9FLAO|nr:S8 family serine peptidase [Thermaurantimonas aggregans]MCX8148779.1 S8 family serine peptidase [Thermaurantimonas aggregans]GCD76836.1 serine protease [Thermaurantimonas aggregans]
MRKGILILLFALASVTYAQQHYIVYLKDKGSNIHLLSDPQKFLSTRALLRKQAHNIPIDATDLPVCNNYIKAVSEVIGTEGKILQKSKWLNTLFLSTSEYKINQIAQLPFVTHIEPYTPKSSITARTQIVNHGLSKPQIEMLKGQFLHNQGYLGQGMLIAVFDGGFFNTDNASVFDSLYQSGRLKFTYNFNNNSSNVYFPGSHGTAVLGVLASYAPGQMIGTAPKADYILLQTEFEPTETRQEEYNWLAGAELSDSLGVDIINSSLGYSTFDNPADNYTVAQLNGQTAIVTQAALWAARKGMLVVNSAGNEGNSSWQKILFPADADSILAVGGVNSAGQRVNFSSMGPTADQRIKPDVAAQAFQVFTINSSGNATTANGTSFSAPLISGLAACLWQMYPNKSFFDIRNAILQSGHMASNPDTLLGYGIPDFQLAAQLLLNQSEIEDDKEKISIFPNPVRDELHVKGLESAEIKEIRIYDGYGRLVKAINKIENGDINVSSLPSGIYFITFTFEGHKITKKILKL